MQFGAQDRRRLTDIGRGGMKPGISHWDLKKEGKGQNVEHIEQYMYHMRIVLDKTDKCKHEMQTFINIYISWRCKVFPYIITI